MVFCFIIPGLLDWAIIAAIVLLLWSGPVGGAKWAHSVGRRITALQVQLGPARQNALWLIAFVLICIGLAIAMRQRL